MCFGSIALSSARVKLEPDKASTAAMRNGIGHCVVDTFAYSLGSSLVNEASPFSLTVSHCFDGFAQIR